MTEKDVSGEITLEIFSEAIDEYGLDRFLQISKVVTTMSKAVEEEFGQTEDLLPAIELMSKIVKLSKEKINAIPPGKNS